MARLFLAGELGRFKSCDLIIEAVVENMDVKKNLFKKIDAIGKNGAVIASNT